MRTIRQPDRAYSYSLSAEHPPIASVAYDESVLIDAFEGRPPAADDLYSPKCPVLPRANPQKGLLFIEGAEPGDTRLVRVEQIEPAKAFAVTALIPEFGKFTGTKQTATLDQPLPDSTRVLPIEECRLRFHETPWLPPGIR
jgi:acetamidase/formamidase